MLNVYSIFELKAKVSSFHLQIQLEFLFFDQLKLRIKLEAIILAAFPTTSVLRLVGQLNTCFFLYKDIWGISPVRWMRRSPQFPQIREARRG